MREIDYVYLAGPFFNPRQLTYINAIEQLLTDEDIKFFSPRVGGTLASSRISQGDDISKTIYKNNIDAIDDCNIIVAVIDDFDTGTIFEMGYAAARQKRIISISAFNHGLNIMLAESVQAHVQNFEELLIAIKDPDDRGVLLRDLV